MVCGLLLTEMRLRSILGTNGTSNSSVPKLQLTSIPDHNNFVVIHVDLSRGFYRLHVMRGARVYDGKWIGSCHNKFAVALKASLSNVGVLQLNCRSDLK